MALAGLIIGAAGSFGAILMGLGSMGYTRRTSKRLDAHLDDHR